MSGFLKTHWKVVECNSQKTMNQLIEYSYWLGSRTTAVLFDPQTDLLPEAASGRQQIRSRVKPNCCGSRSQSITVLLYSFIFFKVFSFSLSTHMTNRCFQYTCPSSPRIWTTQRHCDVNFTWLNKWWINNEYTTCWLLTMMVYNKTVIDWLLQQQYFSLTYERICCPQPMASGNRCVVGPNKTAVVLEPSQ